MTHPLDPLIILRHRLEQEAEKLGLTLRAFNIILPEHLTDPTAAAVIFEITPEAVKTADEKTDDIFESIIASFETTEEEKPDDKLKKEIEQRLKDGKGIFD
jgi:hypothetical protein